MGSMRDRLIYILKHSPLIQKLYVVVMSFVFRLWGAAVKTDEQLVLFVSFMGKGFNDSPKVLFPSSQSLIIRRNAFRCFTRVPLMPSSA